MYDFEYNMIIDKWSDRLSMEVSEKSRDALIHMFKNVVLRLNDNVGFEIICERILTRAYLEMKYPGLNIFDSMYYEHNLN